MAEQIEVFDNSGKVIRLMDREEAETRDLLLPNVIVFIFNSKGDVWLGKRPMTKAHYPRLWDVSACGGLKPREDPAIGAKREQLEEMGFSSELTFAKSFINEFADDTGKAIRRRMSYVYVGFSDKVPEANEEVDEFKAWNPEKLSREIASHPELFIPSMQVELDIALAKYLQTKK